MNIRLVTDDAAPKKQRILTEVRALHSQTISKRESLEARMADLVASMARLQEAPDAEAAATAALNAIGAERAVEMERWSKRGTGPMPSFDPKPQQEAKAALDIAAEQAAAARSAAAALGEEYNRVAAELTALEPKLVAGVVAIMLESAEPIVEELRHLRADLVRKEDFLNQLVDIAGKTARPAGAGIPVGNTGDAINGFIEIVRGALAPPFAHSGPAVTAWQSLAERLRTDALAELQT
jgi:hypothetical protein